MRREIERRSCTHHFYGLGQLALAVSILFTAASHSGADGAGYLSQDGRRLFPLGFYELPKDDAKLAEMADAGVNLLRCGRREDLDRLHAVGISAVMPLALQQGATDGLRKKIESVKDHPALAMWEGPDEIVWNFTAYSGLYKTKGVYKSPDEWRRQTPLAVEYSESRAAEIMPKLRESIQLLRSLDEADRPLWFNEAHESDVKFVRQYLDQVDITGCDLYPVKHDVQPIAKIGAATDLWRLVGRDKPVFMVLQAFSWHELGDYYGHKKPAYPTFAESRFMAYDAIVHGARGVLYWGSGDRTPDPFRQSLYALVSELSALQPFLVANDKPGVNVTLIEPRDRPIERGVRVAVRNDGDDWFVLLVNEDDRRHMGVEVSGLADLDGRKLQLLYGAETATPQRGEFVTRMQPFEVKLFATDRRFESSRRAGRDYKK